MNAWLHQHHRSRRRGQSLVIIALSATALLGIIALGMDAGRLYFQRRDVQNAADAGALAGAEELISSGAIAGQTTGMRTQANCQASLYALNNLALTPSNPTCDSSYQPNGSGFIRESSNDGTATVTVWTPSRGVSNEIHVQVSYRVPLTFAAVIGFTSSAVVADAYAHGGFYNKTYTVFGFDAGGSGNSVNFDQNGNAQIDDGANGMDMCTPSSVNGKLVSNSKWHAPTRPVLLRPGGRHPCLDHLLVRHRGHRDPGRGSAELRGRPQPRRGPAQPGHDPSGRQPKLHERRHVHEYDLGQLDDLLTRPVHVQRQHQRRRILPLPKRHLLHERRQPQRHRRRRSGQHLGRPPAHRALRRGHRPQPGVRRHQRGHLRHRR